ncbi:MAG TPA: hypothetical protein VEW94_08175 [Chloroflexia bacterium]|nr:hypothetical protein [Chloroflexia bacterium]
MERRSQMRLHFPVAFVLLLCALTIVGCAGAPKDSEASAPILAGPTPLPPVATPTIDMGRARQAFETGGELSYEEVIALQKEIVGELELLMNRIDQIVNSKEWIGNEKGPFGIRD